MAMRCGDDCKKTVLYERNPNAKYWRPFDDNCEQVAVYIKQGSVERNESGHCPSCGRKLGFAPDGTPTVGPSYAELERKANALDRLERVLGVVGGGNIDTMAGGSFVHDDNDGNIVTAATLLDLADALPAPDCTTCAADCADRGKPHNQRSMTAEECRANRCGRGLAANTEEE